MSEPVPTSIPSTSRRPKWMLGCGALLALALAGCIGAGITFWWLQRPIKAVVLSEPERIAVEEKLSPLTTSGYGTRSSEIPPQPATPAPRADNTYEPGSKSLLLTERELNGLLEQNTGQGDRIRLSLDRGAVNAYLAVPLPDDLPVLGGVMLRGRGRFLVDAGADRQPRLQLEDVTLFGLSLPSAWLGGLKGRDLLSDTIGKEGRGMPGIRELVVEPGQLRIELED